MQLGDTIARALEIVGVTESRVAKWVECRCKERRERLNRLGSWATRVIQGKIERAKEYLNEILESE